MIERPGPRRLSRFPLGSTDLHSARISSGKDAMTPTELLQAAYRIGIPLDPAAATAFRLAAVQLAQEVGSGEQSKLLSCKAAAALVAMAVHGDTGRVCSYLNPDPTRASVTWTVACYQIGDLTPSALKDFSDPCDAIAVLAACPESNHVAAELVASTPEGLRWTAMLRMNDDIAFQLPDPTTASGDTTSNSGELAAALVAWRRRLAVWASSGSDDAVVDLVEEATGPPAAGFQPSPKAAPAGAMANGDVVEIVRLVVQAAAIGQEAVAEARPVPEPRPEPEARPGVLPEPWATDLLADVDQIAERIETLAGAALTRTPPDPVPAVVAALEPAFDTLAARVLAVEEAIGRLADRFDDIVAAIDQQTAAIRAVEAEVYDRLADLAEVRTLVTPVAVPPAEEGRPTGRAAPRHEILEWARESGLGRLAGWRYPSTR